MNHVPVVDYMEFGLAGDLALVVKDRAMEGDIEGLPLAGPTGCVHERLGPAIERPALPIRISDVVVGIQDLDLILAHEKYPTVSTALAIALGHLWGRKLNMQAAGAELFPALQVPAPTHRLKGTVDQFPLGWLAVPSRPVGQACLRAVEKNLCALWGLGGLGIMQLGLNNGWLGLLLRVAFMDLDPVDPHVLDILPIHLAHLLPNLGLT